MAVGDQVVFDGLTDGHEDLRMVSYHALAHIFVEFASVVDDVHFAFRLDFNVALGFVEDVRRISHARVLARGGWLPVFVARCQTECIGLRQFLLSEGCEL